MAYPGDRCCTFYEKRDYAGNQHTECMREDETDHTYNTGGFGNYISSYECGKNVRFEFHNHNDPSTGYEVVSGAGHVRSSRIEGWMEDRVTKVIMRPYDQWKKGSATVWGWLNCEDIAAELPASSSLDEVVTYTGDEAWKLGMKEGELESFSLPWGYELTLYENDAFSGAKKSYTGKKNTDDNEFMDCINVEDDWRNRARSYSVRKI